MEPSVRRRKQRLFMRISSNVGSGDSSSASSEDEIELPRSQSLPPVQHHHGDSGDDDDYSIAGGEDDMDTDAPPARNRNEIALANWEVLYPFLRKAFLLQCDSVGAKLPGPAAAGVQSFCDYPNEHQNHHVRSETTRSCFYLLNCKCCYKKITDLYAFYLFYYNFILILLIYAGSNQQVPYCTLCDGMCDDEPVPDAFIEQYALLRRHGLFPASPTRTRTYFQISVLRLFTFLRIASPQLGMDAFRFALGQNYTDCHKVNACIPA